MLPVMSSTSSGMHCPFAKLPLELVEHISDYLPRTDIPCLALTTKTLYHDAHLRKCWDPKFRGKKQQRLEFLDVLLRDVPGYTCCDFCLRLQPKKPTPKIYPNWEGWAMCPGEVYGSWLHFEGWDFHLEFADLRDVMKRLRRGAPYGEDCDSIAVQTSWEPLGRNDIKTLRQRRDRRDIHAVNPGACLKKLEVEPRVIDKTLLLRTTQRMFYGPSLRRTLREQGIGRHLFRHCQHWNCSQTEYFMSKEMVDVESAINDAIHNLPSTHNRKDVKTISETKSCPCCITEWYVTVWDHGSFGIEVALTTATNLGPCRTRDEFQWQVAAYHRNKLYVPYKSRPQWHREGANLVSFNPMRDGNCQSAVGHPSFVPSWLNLDAHRDIVSLPTTLAQEKAEFNKASKPKQKQQRRSKNDIALKQQQKDRAKRDVAVEQKQKQKQKHQSTTWTSWFVRWLKELLED